jgi:ribosomal protein S18 acetylase RimI-like enzyme
VSVTVRVLGSADAAAFRALRLQALAEDRANFASIYEDERDTPLSVVAQRMVAAPDRAIVGAFDGPTLVGLAAWHREEIDGLEHQGFVWGVFVSPSHRGQGLARLLLNRVIDLARRAQGIKELTLVAYADNGHALALYESLGFVTHGRQPNGSGADSRPDDLHMRLRL